MCFSKRSPLHLWKPRSRVDSASVNLVFQVGNWRDAGGRDDPERPAFVSPSLILTGGPPRLSRVSPQRLLLLLLLSLTYWPYWHILAGSIPQHIPVSYEKAAFKFPFAPAMGIAMSLELPADRLPTWCFSPMVQEGERGQCPECCLSSSVIFKP